MSSARVWIWLFTAKPCSETPEKRADLPSSTRRGSLPDYLGSCNLNPLIYPLNGTACCRDITTGSNGEFSAAPGYDRLTGLGAPDVKQLMLSFTSSRARFGP